MGQTPPQHVVNGARRAPRNAHPPAQCMHLSSRYYACVATRSRGSRDTRYRGAAALLRGDARLVDERSRRLRKSLAARTHEVRARVPSPRICDVRTRPLCCAAHTRRDERRIVPFPRNESR